MASGKPNKLAFLSMPAPASYVAGLGRGCVFRNFSKALADRILVLLDSPLVQISVLQGKVPQRRSSRA